MFEIRSGAAVPALVSWSVFTAPATPDTVRLLTVRQLLSVLLETVPASIVTVLVLPLVMTMPYWSLAGGSPADQLTAISHLPLAGLIQEFWPNVVALVGLM